MCKLVRLVLAVVVVVFSAHALKYHQDSKGTEIHTPFRWVVADSAARVALSITRADTAKFLFQRADTSVWCLTDSPAAWRFVGGKTVDTMNVKRAIKAFRAHVDSVDTRKFTCDTGYAGQEFSALNIYSTSGKLGWKTSPIIYLQKYIDATFLDTGLWVSGAGADDKPLKCEGVYSTGNSYVVGGLYGGDIYADSGVFRVLNGTQYVTSPIGAFGGSAGAIGGIARISLLGSTGNAIHWVADGLSAPAFSSRSNGTKLILYPSLNATNADYGVGLNVANMWFSVPQATTTYSYSWYGGTSAVMTLRGDSLLSIDKVSSDSVRSRVAFLDSATIAGRLAVSGRCSTVTLATNGNLDLRGGSRLVQFFNASGTAKQYVGLTGDTSLFLGPALTALTVAQTTGRVGVNTLAPSATFQVNGHGLATSFKAGICTTATFVATAATISAHTNMTTARVASACTTGILVSTSIKTGNVATTFDTIYSPCTLSGVTTTVTGVCQTYRSGQSFVMMIPSIGGTSNTASFSIRLSMNDAYMPSGTVFGHIQALNNGTTRISPMQMKRVGANQAEVTVHFETFGDVLGWDSYGIKGVEEEGYLTWYK